MRCRCARKRETSFKVNMGNGNIRSMCGACYLQLLAKEEDRSEKSK